MKVAYRIGFHEAGWLVIFLTAMTLTTFTPIIELDLFSNMITGASIYIIFKHIRFIRVEGEER